ncbi:MAG: glycosyltransferase family 4 protein [Anaerolineae bacterium]
MRLAILGTYPADPNRIEGGLHSVLCYLVEGLLQEAPDMEIHVVTGFSPGEGIAAPHQVDGVWVHPFTWSRFKRLTLYQRDVARIRRLVEEVAPDLVHAQAPSAAYAVAAMTSGRPYVVTWHGVMFREAAVVPGLRAKAVYALEVLYERYCWRRLKDVIAISPYVEREYRGMTRARFHLIENPISDRFFALQGEGEPDRILCAARIIPRKDILTLLRAFALLREERPGACLRIAGEMASEPAYAAQCLEFVRQHGLEGSVHFLGQLSEEEVLEEYQRCSLVALSSLQETAPMTVKQALAAGRPVVATPAGGVPWLVRDGVTGILVPFRDPERMAMAFRRLLGDAALRRWMGERGRAEARGRFHASVVAQKTLGVYRELLSRG